MPIEALPNAMLTEVTGRVTGITPRSKKHAIQRGSCDLPTPFVGSPEPEFAKRTTKHAKARLLNLLYRGQNISKP